MNAIDVDPLRVHALVVGIEKYKIGEHWNLKGPAKDGLRFIDWLLSKGVLPEHISFFVSPLAENRCVQSSAEEKGVKSKPATCDNIRTYIDEKLLSDHAGGELLHVFWGGHGSINTALREDRLLHCADFTAESNKSIAIETLIEALRSSDNQVFERQILFIDACASLDFPASYEAIRSAKAAIEFSASGSLERVEEQHVLFAAARYETASNDSAKGTGTFSDLVLHLLQYQALWPDIKIIEPLIRADEKLLPASYSYEGPSHKYDRDSRESNHGLLEKKIPSPNPGCLRKPNSQPVFFLNSPSANRQSPLQNVEFNLELFLGLERKGFLAIVAGFEGDNIFNSLRAIEYELQVNIQQRTDYTTPPRWWIRINVDELTALPRRLSDVWQHISDADEITEYLVQHGMPDCVTPGIILEADGQNLESELLQNIRDWCKSLSSKIFAGLSVAIIINLQFHLDSAVSEISAKIEQVEKHLVGLSDEITQSSIVKLLLLQAYRYKKRFHIPDSSSFLGKSKLETNGFHLYSWALNTIKKGLLGNSEFLHDPSKIFRIYNEQSINHTGDFSIAVSARKLLDDIDTYASSLNGEEGFLRASLYRQFLELARRDSPDILHSLMAAYASSRHTEAYRQALCFACTYNNFYSDILIDAFLSGIDNSFARENFVQNLNATKNEWLIFTSPNESFVDKLGLALLRRWDKGNYFQEPIQRLLPRLSSNIRLVVSFRFQECNGEKLRCRIDSDANILAYLINSGFEANSLLKLIKNGRYRKRESHIWLLSTCLLSYAECLEELLIVNKEFLILWGLHSTEDSLPLDKESREGFLLYWRNYLPY